MRGKEKERLVELRRMIFHRQDQIVEAIGEAGIPVDDLITVVAMMTHAHAILVCLLAKGQDVEEVKKAAFEALEFLQGGKKGGVN